MRVLALDAATEACSVALQDGEELIGRFEETGRGHAERILALVDDVLSEAQLSLAALDGIAASVGPGSFTGVRITVVVAQGLAYGAGLPVAAVSTLEALALQAMQGGGVRALACLDARMAEVYWGCFTADAVRGLRARGPPRVSPPAEVRWPDDDPAAPHPDDPPVLGIGRGFSAYPALAALPGLRLAGHAARALPNARDVARLGAMRLAAGEGRDPADLEPLYLRDKVAATTAERAAK